MVEKGRPQVIALEEHYWDKELVATYHGGDRLSVPALEQRLYDLDELRIKEMDEAGVDYQVISHGASSSQNLPADISLDMTKRVNDRLYEAIKRHPKRFGGFAAVPTHDAKIGADELSRCVNELGFHGAMLHGLADGVFLDDQRFWPIYERAEKLDVPIYFHPAAPQQAVVDRYYKEYVKVAPAILNAGWGFTVEAATTAIRLVLSGVFEKHPNLKCVLGHLGEGIPFLIARMDEALSRNSNVRFREVFSSHFSVTTSGFFSNPALLCTMQELGIDRILFSIDYPFVKNTTGTDWLKTVPLCEEDKIKLMSGNAKRLLKIK
ncbi:MAG TPA: amidohydrolase family protein [Xanthobacteraceae bacterium]|nr:amidohydrolase family protein [Xanthobacteraceae bacterium]